MELSQKISRERLATRVGLEMAVIIDEITPEGAVGRTYADAPEIDGTVKIPGAVDLQIGDMVMAYITESSAYDLTAVLVEPDEEDEWDF